MRALLAYAVAAALVLGGLWLLDVFTWTGLAYAVGLGDGATLRWPAGTRAVTIVLAAGSAAVATAGLVAHLDWRDAVYRPETRADRWAIVPASMKRRANERRKWWVAGLKNWRKQTARAVQLARPAIEAGNTVHAVRDQAAHDEHAA